MPDVATGITVVKAGGPAAGAALRFFSRTLGPGEPERIRLIFAAALRSERLSAAQRIDASKGGGRKVMRMLGGAGRKARDETWGRRNKGQRKQKKEVLEERKRIHRAIQQGATTLTERCFEREPTNEDGNLEDWVAILERRIGRTAEERLGGDEGAAWRYLVTGSWNGTPTQTEIASWAVGIADAVVKGWRDDPGLVNVVTQRTVESELELDRALVDATNRISDEFRWFALTTATLLVLGGGGTALLVLYIDHG